MSDFCSFYHLPSTVIGNKQHKKLNAVYSYYNVATSIPLLELMRDLLVVARNDGADVVNALDVMDNASVFKELHFGQGWTPNYIIKPLFLELIVGMMVRVGDGFLQYYVYNWKCPAMEPSSVGLVLL